VALFIERAQAVKPDFELSADNAAVIVESGMIASMAALASVAVARNDNESLLAAARLFGSVDMLLPARDMQLLPPDVRVHHQQRRVA
jgi:hypothetical protein